MNIELPPTIAAFFQALNAHDTDTFTALFAGDAFVAGSLLLLFVLLAAGERGFRIWKRLWRIP